MCGRWLVSFALALVGTMAVTTTASAQSRRITGKVIDTSTGAGVEGATVEVPGDTPITATTAADGAFSLAKLPREAFTLSIAAEGYDAAGAPVEAGRKPLELVIYVTPAKPEAPPTRALSGFITDAATGAPVAGAQVQVQGTQLSTFTDRDGLFVISGAPPEDLVLEVSADAFGATTVPAAAGQSAVRVPLQSTVAAEPEPEPEMPLEAARTVTGRVLDDTGQPVIGATVTVVGTSLGAITDAAGGYVIDDVPPGPVTISVESYGYDTATGLLGAGQSSLDFAMPLAAEETIIIEGRAPVIVKQNLANGASTVQADALTRVTAPTLEDAMQGKISAPTSSPTRVRPVVACSCACAASRPSTAVRPRCTSSTVCLSRTSRFPRAPTP